LNGVLDDAGFDNFLRGAMPRFLSHEAGTAVVLPGVYFRLLLIGFFEGIGSERASAGEWRQSELAQISELWIGRSHAGSRNDLANAAVAGLKRRIRRYSRLC